MQKMLTWLKQPSLTVILPDIIAGILFALVNLAFSISLASLVFSGPLEHYLPYGITIALTTSIISVIFVGIFTSSPGILPSVQDNPALLMAISTSSIAAMIGGEEDLFITVISLIFISTVLTGAFLLLVGIFNLGGMVRYIPYPVIGGFIAGTGWLLAQGAIEATSGYALGFDNLRILMQSDQLMLWMPGVLLGAALFWGGRRFDHFLTMPTILVGGLALFFVILFLSGLSISEATQRGLLLGDIGKSAPFRPFPLPDLGDADWGSIANQYGNILAILVLTIINLLLNISGIELALQKDVDLNRELRVAGSMNLISGVSGGMIAFHELSDTVISWRIGARGRLASIIQGLAIILVILVGSSMLIYMPRFVLGGMLLFLGFDFLNEWVIEGYRRLKRIDYAVVLLILFIVATSGFLIGIGVGIVLMVVIFVWNYSRISIVHHEFSDGEIVSHVERNANYRKELNKLGSHNYILELKGFIFFGTANTLLETIRKRLNRADTDPLEHVIIDFRRVNGLDSSAVFSFARVKHLLNSENVKLLLTHLSKEMERELTRNGLIPDENFRFFPGLELALEWCEDRLLEKSQVTRKHMPVVLEFQLAANGFSKAYGSRLRTYLTRITFEPGDYLIREGSDLPSIYFIELGQVSIYLTLDDEKQILLRRLIQGTVVGELGFFLNTPPTASVIADLETSAYQLTQEKFQEMKTQDPELAVEFTELMVRMVSERLIHMNREVAAMHR